jgi:hypothetical protein
VARSLDEIVAAAVEMVEPPGSIRAFRTQLTACINTASEVHRRFAGLPPPGAARAQAGAYLEALFDAKKAASTVKSFYQSDDFLAALEHEIRAVDAIATFLVVPAGARPRDIVAEVAAIMARDLIDPDPYRHPENRGKDWPVIECPWRRPATLTDGGAWLVLTSLIYEGATGVELSPERSMKYCRGVDKASPRYVLKGLRFQR